MSAIPPPLQNITVVGATGALGSVVFNKLVDSGLFTLQVLRRADSTTAPSIFPPSIKVKDVDLSSVDALASALQGQDAVVCLLGGPGIGLQRTLIDASIRAGVRRFIPSEFGSDLSNPHNRPLLPFLDKVAVEDYLALQAETTNLSYTIVYNGAFLDWGLERNFLLGDLSGDAPTLFDGGDALFTATTLQSVAEGVVGVLTHADDTRNRVVYLGDFVVSQNELLAVARSVAPHKAWEPRHATLDEATAEADARVAAGIIDLHTIMPYLYRSLMHPQHGGRFARNDSAMLGVSPKDKSVIERTLQKILLE